MERNWKGKPVVIVGAARQGLALARFLAGRGARVTINDQRQPEAMQAAIQTLAGTPADYAVNWVLGSHPLALLDGCELVCVSGGVPLNLPILVEARRRQIELTNDSQIFMEAVRAPVIGITGSAGKTTTTTLVGRMAQAEATALPESGRSAWVGGNIGLPLVEYVDTILAEDRVIVELSSFQLELMTCSPQVSAVLNITPNHLDRHGTLENYTAAKANILTHQDSSGITVLNREDPGAWSLAGQVRGRLVSFGWTRPRNGLAGTFIDDERLFYVDEAGESLELMPRSIVRLRGEHMLMNVLAACALAVAVRMPVEAMQAGVREFEGVAHRLEWVRTWNGVQWYNDSIATAPERTLAAIQAFDEPLVLLLGGRDKNLPWEKLAGLIRQRVDHVIVFGEAAAMIARAIQPEDYGAAARLKSVHQCENLREAMQAAAELAQPGSVVLLSPGGTSYDEFRDFEERGERFREWVKALT
jgi:UDP-N-acetylmuramoylalanine--D-glutamate ligase